MNDRYLFRGKRIDNGGWITGYYSFTNECHFIDIYPNSEEVDPETIGQCTGLKDKNGVLIFEGDILHCIDVRDNETKEYEGVVVFEDYMWCVNNSNCDAYLCYYNDNNSCAVTEIEIIGNIHNHEG